MPTKTIAPGITRFDIPERNTHGCLIRICRQGRKYQEFFSDSIHGGKRKSQLAAARRYQQLKEQLPEPGTTRDQITRRNISGRVGVYESVSRDAAGNPHRSFCAGWTDEQGRRHKINFSLRKYGEKRSWELACFARERRLADRIQVLAEFEKRREFRAPRRKK